MLRGTGTILLLIAGCVLLPVSLVAVLLLPRRDGQGWRSMPPRR